MNTLGEYENKAVQKTLLSSYCPELIRDAREKQDELLKDRYAMGQYAFADIGCGDGYHGVMFKSVSRLYHGYEIAPAIAQIARDRWTSEGIEQARVYEGNAAEMDLPETEYDVIFCLYFTPGNFRDKSDSLDLYTEAYLDQNPVFIALVSRFYSRLAESGSFFLTVYKDVPEAEAAQIDFYEKTGQRVITPAGSRFVATAENSWSTRWTKASMLSNLSHCGIDQQQVIFHDLNAISWMIEIQSAK